jgi:peptidoglycan/xylan/chitin deacetylase (PgdA/CDA1 family)
MSPDGVQWPAGARCAALLTFDFDAELIWRGVARGASLGEKVTSIGEYGARRGVQRILATLGDHGLTSTFMVPGANAVRYRDVVQAIADGGHEIGNHGFCHENFGLLSREEQLECLTRTNAALEDITGKRVDGYRTPAGDMTEDTIDLLLELGFTWSSSTRGDDRPYRVWRHGEATELVEIPAHWELDDFPQFMFSDDPPFPVGQSRIASYSAVVDYWKTEFDAYYEEGLCFVMLMHPQTIGTPGRIGILEELIEHIRCRSDAWITTVGEVADWWRAHGSEPPDEHPAAVYDRSRRSRAHGSRS